MAIDDLVERVASYGCGFVEVTGGEPMLQARVHGFMRTLLDRGHEVAIETSGACDIDAGGDCDPRVVRIVDLKTPGSGESGRNDWANVERLRPTDEVKFVICDRADYEWARGVVRERDLPGRVAAVLFSPVFEQAPGLEILGAKGLPMRDLAAWILEDRLDVTLQAQLHKFIWEPQTRGV